MIAHAPLVHGRSLPTTISPGLMAQAAARWASGSGVAVIRPRDGAVRALVGLAVSAPQPPGSTFKIITVSAALQSGVATPSTTYPVRSYATLSGVQLRNAGGEACGGSLTEAFTVSCNSVFAPLGAQIGAQRLVAMARAFGFNEQPKLPAAMRSTISAPSRLRDNLAVGAAAIGQDRDLATPLQMASVGATIALDGRRIQPRITTIEPVLSKKVLSTKVAHEVRSMMLDVVRSGTGTAAAIAGVEVAGKTGTAELHPNSTNLRTPTRGSWPSHCAAPEDRRCGDARRRRVRRHSRRSDRQASPAGRPQPRLTREQNVRPENVRCIPIGTLAHTRSKVGIPISPSERGASQVAGRG